MTNIVFTEQRPFSFIDFLPRFEVNGREYTIDYGTLRNKFSQLRKKGEIQLDYKSKQAFYTMKGHKFGKKLMTINHLGVQASDPITKLISLLPFGKNALHDIHLRFQVKGIWALLSTNSALRIGPVSKDLRLPTLKFRELEIRLTIHRSDTASVVVGCSYAPIAVDCVGIIRLSNALTRVEERLSRLIESCNDTVTSDSNISGNSSRMHLIPEHKDWLVTMWHFGVDSITEYTGDKFSATWEVGQNALIRAYSKDMKEQGRTIRLERQEYPNKSFADAIEEKLRGRSLIVQDGRVKPSGDSL
jgi:hypothetical protein